MNLRSSSAGRRVFLPAAAFLLVAAVAGCGSTGVATVRTIQLSPGTASIDAFVSDTQVGVTLAYSDASSYVQISDGSHTVELSPGGQDQVSLHKEVADFFANTNSTIFVVNPTASITSLVVTDDNTQPLANDFKLRILHGSPSAGVVDVYVTAPSVPIASVPATFRNVTYQTTQPYLQLATGSYEVRFTAAGTKTVLADTAAVTFAVGEVSTVALADAPAGGPPYQAYPYVDAMYSNNLGQ